MSFTFREILSVYSKNILGNLFEYVASSPCYGIIITSFLPTNAVLAGKLLMFMLTSAKMTKKIYDVKTQNNYKNNAEAKINVILFE